MVLFFDSLARACIDCLRPRVLLASLLPLLVVLLLAWAFGYFLWDWANASVTGLLEHSRAGGAAERTLQGLGKSGDIKSFLAPLLVMAVSTPVIFVISLVSVAVAMTPALVSMVARRRFPQLARLHGGSLAASAMWSAGSALVAVIAVVASIPLWFILPFGLLLPPLIWGWLTYRVMVFDALADHASKDERRAIFRRHRWTLLGIGVMCGWLGAAPSIVWASSVFFVAAFVVLVPVAVWIYTLVFAFSSLWFTHYCLQALEALRRDAAVATRSPALHALPATPIASAHDLPQ